MYVLHRARASMRSVDPYVCFVANQLGLESVRDLAGYGDPLTSYDVVESIDIMCTEFGAVCDALTAGQACCEECGTGDLSLPKVSAV